jgi:putative transposase
MIWARMLAYITGTVDQELEERNRQGKQNRLLFPLPNRGASGDNGIVRCKERLGGLLKYYEREAA